MKKYTLQIDWIELVWQLGFVGILVFLFFLFLKNDNEFGMGYTAGVAVAYSIPKSKRSIIIRKAVDTIDKKMV